MTATTSTGHFAMSQTVVAAEPIPSGSRDGVDDGAGEDDRQRDEREHEDHDERDEDLERAQLPERPALGRLVDDVRRAHERADVAGGRPQRGAETDEEQHAGRAPVGRDRLDRAGERVRRGVGADLGDDVGDRLRRLHRVAEDPEHRDERDERREQREQPVVRERRRPVGEVVLAELLHRALQRREDARARLGAFRAVVGAPGRADVLVACHGPALPVVLERDSLLSRASARRRQGRDPPTPRAPRGA